MRVLEYWQSHGSATGLLSLCLSCNRKVPDDQGFHYLHEINSSQVYIQRFSGRLKLHALYKEWSYKLKCSQPWPLINIDAAVYMFCISGHGWLHFSLQLHTAFNLPENLCTAPLCCNVSCRNRFWTLMTTYLFWPPFDRALFVFIRQMQNKVCL